MTQLLLCLILTLAPVPPQAGRSKPGPFQVGYVVRIEGWDWEVAEVRVRPNGVSFRIKDTDLYGRTSAEWWVEGDHYSAALMDEHAAVIFYSSPCFSWPTISAVDQ